MLLLEERTKEPSLLVCGADAHPKSYRQSPFASFPSEKEDSSCPALRHRLSTNSTTVSSPPCPSAPSPRPRPGRSAFARRHRHDRHQRERPSPRQPDARRNLPRHSRQQDRQQHREEHQQARPTAARPGPPARPRSPPPLRIVATERVGVVAGISLGRLGQDSRHDGPLPAATGQGRVATPPCQRNKPSAPPPARLTPPPSMPRRSPPPPPSTGSARTPTPAPRAAAPARSRGRSAP